MPILSRYRTWSYGAIMLALSLITILWGKEPTMNTKTMQQGHMNFTIPSYLPQGLHQKGIQMETTVYGSMDERGMCYFQYVAIHTSAIAIEDKLLIPTKSYQLESQSKKTTINLGNGNTGFVQELYLKAVKPCGKIVEDTLRVIKFTAHHNQQNYAVAGILRPTLRADKIDSIARSGIK